MSHRHFFDTFLGMFVALVVWVQVPTRMDAYYFKYNNIALNTKVTETLVLTVSLLFTYTF